MKILLSVQPPQDVKKIKGEVDRSSKQGSARIQNKRHELITSDRAPVDGNGRKRDT